jgi:hypothetical protein
LRTLILYKFFYAFIFLKIALWDLRRTTKPIRLFEGHQNRHQKLPVTVKNDFSKKYEKNVKNGKKWRNKKYEIKNNLKNLKKN